MQYNLKSIQKCSRIFDNFLLTILTYHIYQYMYQKGKIIIHIKKVQAQGELEDEVNNQQMEKLDSRCLKATASHSGQRACKCLVGAACRLVRAARLELLVTRPEPLCLDSELLL